MYDLMLDDFSSESLMDVTTESQLRFPVFIERFGLLCSDRYVISSGSKIYLQSKTILEVKVGSFKTSNVWLDAR